MRIIRSCELACVLMLGLCGNAAIAADSNGRAIEFLVEENGAVQSQVALVQGGKILIRQAGGDPNLDVLFDAAAQTLFIVDHLNKSYFRIDDNVINKAASMIESLTAVAESQGGVLSDLLGTLGFSEDEQEAKIEIRRTERILSAFKIDCRLYQQFRNDNLESELCISSRENLGALGDHYDTLEAFYAFGDKLLTHAGAILVNMGVVVPDLKKLSESGLPILVYVVAEKLKVSLSTIREQNSPIDYFLLPAGYVQTPIPFIG
jgi:hypothetical protein